jgi:hypothetical protein
MPILEGICLKTLSDAPGTETPAGLTFIPRS